MGVKVGLIFQVLVGFNFPVSDHHSKPTVPTQRRSFFHAIGVSFQAYYLCMVQESIEHRRCDCLIGHEFRPF